MSPNLIDHITGGERWLTKREIALHYRKSTRWIELAQRRGLPSRLIGGTRRYQLSAVDAWMRDAYAEVA